MAYKRTSSFLYTSTPLFRNESYENYNKKSSFKYQVRLWNTKRMKKKNFCEKITPATNYKLKPYESETGINKTVFWGRL